VQEISIERERVDKILRAKIKLGEMLSTGEHGKSNKSARKMPSHWTAGPESQFGIAG
jgi:hypothetical protein